MRFAHRRPRHRPSLVATERGRRDHGYILVEFAVLLVPLLLMVSLSVDVGSWYNRVSDLQKAADAAALAGVVWLPDEDKAETYALAAAARNGFVDGVDGIDITISKVGERRLRVTIQDDDVDSFFYQNLGGRSLDLARAGTAEYVLPVPLGSPRNYFGTGRLLSGSDRELLYQSVNPSCTSKVNGDRYQSLHYGPLYTSGDLRGTSLSSCASTPSNAEYRERGYELYIEAPATRSDAIDVLLYDARYSEANVTWQVQSGENCVTTPGWTGPNTSSTSNITVNGPGEYQTRSTSSSSDNNWSSTQTVLWPNSYAHRRDRIRYRTSTITWSPSSSTWSGPASGAGAGNSITITGPAQYQTRTSASGSGSTWSSTVNLTQGSTFSRAGNLIRYRVGTFPPLSTTTCTPTYTNYADNAIDSMRQNGAESFTFSLRAPDLTPFDDSDNPAVEGCTQTYSASTPFDAAYDDYLGSRRWNKLCTITTAMASGRYVLRVTNGAPGVQTADGSNQWGMVARYQGAAGNGLCDGRGTTPTAVLCPRVYGRDAISVYANTSDATASFFLAEIPDYHVGKTLEIELWDPGEGGSKIEILQPNGSDSWTLHNFDWASFNDNGSSHSSASNVSSVSVTDSVFNGRLLRIRIQLDGYNPPDDNQWWKIQYTFTSGSVTDRTTWSARVVGDPVHLIEETS